MNGVTMKMKRFKNYLGLMVSADDGDWVTVEDCDLDISTVKTLNERLSKIIEGVLIDLRSAEDRMLNVSAINVDLNQQLILKDEMLIEKANVIISQCDILIKQDLSIQELKNKVIKYLAVIWFALTPAILGLTMVLLINNGGGQ